MRFSWDKSKNEPNIQKHGISFDEASSVFLDNFARIIDDPDHSVDEARFIIIGFSQTLRVLTVVYTDKSDNEIRIISARKATKNERKQYQEFMK